MFPCQWIYPGAARQPIGRDKAAKEDGAKEGSKEDVTGRLAEGQENCWAERMSTFDPQD